MKTVTIALILALLELHFSGSNAFVSSFSHARRIRRQAPLPTTRLSALPAAVRHGKGTNAAIAGQLFPILSKFFIGPAKAKRIATNVCSAVDIGDLVLISLLSWAVPPISRFVYNRRTGESANDFDYARSKIYKGSTLVSQLAKIAAIVYVVDVLEIALEAIGVKFPFDISRKCAQLFYTLYAARRFRPFKRYLIEKQMKATSPKDLGRIKFLDRLANVVIYVTTTFIILDELRVPTGRALQSVFALGGVGTLVFSLASKDVASQFVSGLALSASNRFDEGDVILLGDGTQGLVSQMGWMSTDVRGADEVVIKIPNNQLSDQRVSNLSRLTKSQVKQTLWFAYEDIDKIPEIIKQIKREIAASCDDLILDGSRPFRVHWRDYQNDHLEVVVDCHFDHPPASNEYWDIRQTVLMAIARAARNVGVSFDIPNVRVKTRLDPEHASPQDLYGIEEDYPVDGSPNST